MMDKMVISWSRTDMTLVLVRIFEEMSLTSLTVLSRYSLETPHCGGKEASLSSVVIAAKDS